MPGKGCNYPDGSKLQAGQRGAVSAAGQKTGGNSGSEIELSGVKKEESKEYDGSNEYKEGWLK